MARVELSTVGIGVVQDRYGNARGGVAFTLTGGSVFAAATGTSVLSGGQLVSSSDGELPGWLQAGDYAITVEGRTRTFSVGDADSSLPPRAPTVALDERAFTAAGSDPALYSDNLTLTSGTVQMSSAIVIPAGMACAGVTFLNGSTALASGTVQQAVLMRRADRVVVARCTSVAGAAAWAADASKNFPWDAALAADVVDQEVIPGLLVAATTMPTPRGRNGSSSLNGNTVFDPGNRWPAWQAGASIAALGAAMTKSGNAAGKLLAWLT